MTLSRIKAGLMTLMKLKILQLIFQLLPTKIAKYLSSMVLFIQMLVKRLQFVLWSLLIRTKVRLIITYPASTGRNFNEVLRVVDSLQLTDKHKVATPANWQQGEDVVIVPSLKDEEEIKQRFPKGYTAVKPYLRLTPQPESDKAE